MPASPEVYRITGANRGLAEQQAARRRRYLFSMSLRTICFVGAVIASGWLRWVLIAGAIFLPYVAVVVANAGRERAQAAPKPVIVLSDTRAIAPGQPPIADMGRSGGTNPGSSMP